MTSALFVLPPGDCPLHPFRKYSSPLGSVLPPYWPPGTRHVAARHAFTTLALHLIRKGPAMIKVHHLNRSRSHRILWLLEELEQPYTIIPYTRDAQTNLAPPELSLVHPLGKSPMIEIDGTLIVESAAIVETLCTRYAPDMIPDRDTAAYLRHLELIHFAEGSAMTPILLNLYVSRLGDAGKPLHPRISSELDNHYRYMNSLVRPSGHFVLDRLSAADIMLSFPAEIAMRQKRGDDFPALAGFVEMIQDRPAYRRATEKGRVAGD